MGSLENLLINLMFGGPPQPAQEREPSRRRPWHQGPGDADCRWNLFSMYCWPVGQVIFANWLATTSAMSGKSPIHSSRRLVPGSLSAKSASRQEIKSLTRPYLFFLIGLPFTCSNQAP